MSENQESKVQAEISETETISNSVNAEFEDNAIDELNEADIPKNIPSADDSSSRINKKDLERLVADIWDYFLLITKIDLIVLNQSDKVQEEKNIKPAVGVKKEP